jgi:DNA-binding NarL/FixJ family response regulator
MTADGQPTGCVRVVVVDDQALVRTGFAMILSAEDDIEVVGQAGDGRAAVEMVRAQRPDVVLMDVRMPELNGVEATRLLAGPGVDDPVKVLIVTTFDLDEYVFAALRAGASGFLLKDTPAEDLVRAVRTIAAGNALIAPSVTRRLIEQFATALPAEPGPPPPNLDVLTERELEVLRHLARGCSNAEIAEALFVSETTVKTHVGRILMKLHLRDRVQAVVLAYESGLVHPGAS